MFERLRFVWASNAWTCAPRRRSTFVWLLGKCHERGDMYVSDARDVYTIDTDFRAIFSFRSAGPTMLARELFRARRKEVRGEHAISAAMHWGGAPRSPSRRVPLCIQLWSIELCRYKQVVDRAALLKLSGCRRQSDYNHSITSVRNLLGIR